MAKLELINLRKEFSEKIIPVKDISIEVEDGEFLSLLGPSGCGKSTLLRLIAGLDQPTQGRVIIGQQTMNNISPGDRNIAMVFQSYALYPHMTAAENMATGLKIRQIPADEIKQRIEKTAQQLDLSDRLNYKPGKLSGGQRQRVALGRALVRQPDVFLLDEPLSNLDALLREQVRGQLKQIFEEQQKPVVYVTHDQTEAMTLSSKVAVLYEGLIEQLGTPRRIYSHPQNHFVAGFVGSPQMNLLELSCEKNAAILGNFRIPVTNVAQVGNYIVLGIRPEDIQIATPNDSLVIVGTVYLVEELGKEHLISVRVQGSNLTIRALLPVDVPLGNNEEGEQTVRLALPQNAIHWFSWKGPPKDPHDPPQPLHERDRLNLA